jgi:hypothetical protein
MESEIGGVEDDDQVQEMNSDGVGGSGSSAGG